MGSSGTLSSAIDAALRDSREAQREADTVAEEGYRAVSQQQHPLLQSTEDLVALIATAGGLPGPRPGRVPAPGTPSRDTASLLTAEVRAAAGAQADTDGEDELASTPGAPCVMPRAPAPVLKEERDTAHDGSEDLAALRPEDPLRRVKETISGPLLRARFDFPFTVAAWGCSHNYQLGTGQYVAQPAPKMVAPLQGLPDPLCDLACGADHCAAVDVAGRLYTWGLSDHGRLGLQAAKDAAVPTHVRALADEHIVSVACGMYSSACISDDLKLFTWGAGSKGQLGHVDTNDEWLPRLVAGLQGVQVAQVALGFEHTVALDALGQLYTWGSGELGQLGHGKTVSYTSPRRLHDPFAPPPPNSTFRRKKQRDPLFEGLEGKSKNRKRGGGGGKRDAGANAEDAGEAQVPGGQPACPRGLAEDGVKASVAAGVVRAVLGDEEREEGDADFEQGAGVVEEECRREGHHVRGGEDGGEDGRGDAGEGREGWEAREREEAGEVVLVACGAHSSLLLTDRGRLYTWGSSEFGALGLGSKATTALTPTLVTSSVLQRRRFVHVAVGDEHAAAVTSLGNVYTWGQGCFGAVGRAPPNRFSHPPDVKRPHRLALPEGHRARSVSCGGNLTAICMTDASVWVLGDDDFRLRCMRLGDAPPKTSSFADLYALVRFPCACLHVDACCMRIDGVAFTLIICLCGVWWWCVRVGGGSVSDGVGIQCRAQSRSSKTSSRLNNLPLNPLGNNSPPILTRQLQLG